MPGVYLGRLPLGGHKLLLCHGGLLRVGRGEPTLRDAHACIGPGQQGTVMVAFSGRGECPPPLGQRWLLLLMPAMFSALAPEHSVPGLLPCAAVLVWNPLISWGRLASCGAASSLGASLPASCCSMALGNEGPTSTQEGGFEDVAVDCSAPESPAQGAGRLGVAHAPCLIFWRALLRMPRSEPKPVPSCCGFTTILAAA